MIMDFGFMARVEMSNVDASTSICWGELQPVICGLWVTNTRRWGGGRMWGNEFGR